jgi:alpha,alpha-trehalose phosphorylase
MSALPPLSGSGHQGHIEYLDRLPFGTDPWCLRETTAELASSGTRETLFTVGNGLIGVRAASDEGDGAVDPGTYLNGLHTTFPLSYPEDAYGFARVGQTIVAAPTATILRVEVAGQTPSLTGSDIESFERVLDFRAGVLRRELVWDSPGGRLRLSSERLVSLAHRQVVMMSLAVTALDNDVDLDIVSITGDQLATRALPTDDGLDPRRAGRLDDTALTPELVEAVAGSATLAFRCAGSGQVVAAVVDHLVTAPSAAPITGMEVAALDASTGQACHTTRLRARVGEPIRVTKLVGYAVAPDLAAVEQAKSALAAARQVGPDALRGLQRQWLDDFWARSDIEVGGQGSATVAVQQAMRWTIFQLAQATACAEGHGVAAKGVTGSGYSGHYFWDTEVFVLPFLDYTDPALARSILEFRHSLLPAAKRRASELGHRGALFAWRTINGEEASAYFPAGTAQYHIDADIAHAISRYATATGDDTFSREYGTELLVETARFWMSFGFYAADDRFHLHGVTGPDEYTALVDDNVYTNVMARANLLAAAAAAERFAGPADQHVTADEIAAWRRAATAMAVPFDTERGIYPQDTHFLEHQPWDFAGTPADRYPLLLHVPPLTIYRHQVLKQSDLILAEWLLGAEFTPDQKRADFAYYDPLTTSDSTLSVVAQQVMATETGQSELAWDYFCKGLFVDLADTHANTVDGVHIASAGGVWSMVVAGFGGFRDDGGEFRFDPRLPEELDSLAFRLLLRGRRIRVRLTHQASTFEVEDVSDAAEPLTVLVAGKSVRLGEAGTSITVAVAPRTQLPAIA